MTEQREPEPVRDPDDDGERAPFERPPFERDPEAQRAPGADGDDPDRSPPMQAG